MRRLLVGITAIAALALAAPAAQAQNPSQLPAACQAELIQLFLTGDTDLSGCQDAFTNPGPTCESNPEREGCGPVTIDNEAFRHYVAYHHARAMIVRCRYGTIYRGLLSRAAKRQCVAANRKYRPRFPDADIPDSVILTRGLSPTLRRYQSRLRAEEGW